MYSFNLSSYNYRKYPYPENLIRDLYGEKFIYDNSIISNVFDTINTDLSDKNREIIHYRYRDKLVFDEIGTRFEMSGEHVRQIILESLRRIYLHMNKIIKTEKTDKELKDITIKDLGLIIGAYIGLKHKGINTVYDLMLLEKDELYNIPDFKPKYIEDIVHCLEAYGINADKFK